MARDNAIRTQIVSEIFGATTMNKISHTELGNVLNDLNDGKVNNAEIANFRNLPDPTSGTSGQIISTDGNRYQLINAPSGGGTGGLNQSEVDARITALVDDKAETGNTGRWGKNKLPTDTVYTADLPTVPDVSNFLTQSEVDARILIPARIGDTSRWDKSKLPSDTVYTADLPTVPDVSNFLNQSEVDNRINAVIPVAQRVITGGSNGQIYSRTSTGYAWINAPAGLTSSQVDQRINQVIPDNRRIPAGGPAGYVLKKDTNADYDVSWQPDQTGTGGGGGLTQAQVDARVVLGQRGVYTEDTYLAPSVSGVLDDNYLDRAVLVNIEDNNDKTITLPLKSTAGRAKSITLIRFANGNDSGNIIINQHANETGPGIRNLTGDIVSSLTFGGGKTSIIHGIRLTQMNDNGINNWVITGLYNDIDINRLLPAGGTTGQILTKNDNADYAATWQTLDLSDYAQNDDIKSAAKVGGGRFTAADLPTNVAYGTIPDVTSFLTQSQVDARIITTARINNTSRWPKNKLPTDTVYDADIANFITASDIPTIPSVPAVFTTGNTTRIAKNKLPSDIVYTANLPAQISPRTDTEINNLIDNRIPVAQRVATGGTADQVYTRTTSGYEWRDSQDDSRFPDASEGTEGQILHIADDGSGNQEWQITDAPSGGTGGLNQTQVDARINTLIPTAERVLTGGTSGQIYSRTSTGYAWIDAPSGSGTGGLNQSQVDGRIDTLVPRSIRLPVPALADAGKLIEVDAAGDGYHLINKTEVTFDPTATPVTSIADGNLFPLYSGSGNNTRSVISYSTLKTDLNITPTAQRVPTGGTDGQFLTRDGTTGLEWSDLPAFNTSTARTYTGDNIFSGKTTLNGGIAIEDTNFTTESTSQQIGSYQITFPIANSERMWTTITPSPGKSINITSYPDFSTFSSTNNITKEKLLALDPVTAGSTERNDNNSIFDQVNNFIPSNPIRVYYGRTSSNNIIAYYDAQNTNDGGNSNPIITLVRNTTARLNPNALLHGTDLDDIPRLNNSKLPTTIDVDKIPDLDTSKITTGVFDEDRLPPLVDLHVGTANLFGTTSGLVSNSASFTANNGDQVIRFDRSTTGTRIPTSITYNQTTGEFLFPEGAWILCASALVECFAAEAATNDQNSRTLASLVIQYGNNYRHPSNWSYSRWATKRSLRNAANTFRRAARFATNNLPGLLNMPSGSVESKLPLSIAGAVIQSDGVTTTKIRVLWAQQDDGVNSRGGGIDVLTAHLHAVKQ